MTELIMASLKLFAVLIVFTLSSKGVRGQDADLKCQALAFKFYAFAKPSDSLDCKQACDDRFADLLKMPKREFRGENRLSSRFGTLKARANARGVFWIDECVAWIRYCFRQRAAVLTVDKNAPVSQQSASTGPALTCLCRSVFALMQVRKYKPENPEFCEHPEICKRLTGRLNLEDYGHWSCRKSKHVMDASCSKSVPVCPCCLKQKNQFKPVSCPDWPELDELMNEPLELGDEEWQVYDLHGAPQPEEGFPQGTVLEPQQLACLEEQEDPERFKAASLPFRMFDTSACALSGTCAAESSGASQMHSHFEAMSEAREHTHQLQDCLRPPQKQTMKRKAVASIEMPCSISDLVSIQQPQNDLATHGSQFYGAYPFSFAIMEDDEPFFGSQFVLPPANRGEGNLRGSGSSSVDPDDAQSIQVFAEYSDFAADHDGTTLDPDNLQFSQYFSAAGSATSTESSPPAGHSNPDNSAEEKQDSLNTFEGIP